MGLERDVFAVYRTGPVTRRMWAGRVTHGRVAQRESTTLTS